MKLLLPLIALTTASKLQLRQVHIIHRHGDRTPITPLKDEEYWKSTLPEEDVLRGIGMGTELVRAEGSTNNHGAAGRGPFGQLTMMGLLQMVQLGERLREELEHTTKNDDAQERFVNNGRLFTQDKPLHPRRIKVMSTDFPRTIQSVQALLTGLFPDISPETHGPIQIDVRDTNSYLIPDPQPRQSPEQLVLESHLSNRPHLQQREKELRELSRRISKELKQYLGDGASGVSFGIGEEKDEADMAIERPLSWAQMSEILTCLHSRSKLPSTLSSEDVNAVSNHVAWRWFENLKHPVLAKSSMWKFVNGLLESMERKVEIDCRCCECVEDGEDAECVDEPWLRIYSAHDSTLIGLLCLLQLERPEAWPEYGSYLKLELIRQEEDSVDAEEHKKSQYWVRFSLNGQVLRSAWCFDENGEPMSMVPLTELEDMIHLEHDFLDGEDSALKFSWKQGLLTKH